MKVAELFEKAPPVKKKKGVVATKKPANAGEKIAMKTIKR